MPHGSLFGPGLLDGAVPELIHGVRFRAELDAVVSKFRQSSPKSQLSIVLNASSRTDFRGTPARYVSRYRI